MKAIKSPLRRFRFRRVSLVLACVVTLVSPPGKDALAAQSIVPHEAEYKLKISLAGGTMRTVVAQTEKGFTVTSVIRASGLARVFMRGSIKESSEFTVAEEGLRPTLYESSDTLSKKDKFMKFEFNWADKTINGTINGDDYVFDISGATHDRVSIQYELMHKLLNGISSVEYALLDGDKIKQIQVSNIGVKTIKTPFGTFDTIGIQHRARNSSRVSTLWCAPELGYLPVLIEQHRKGKRRVRAVLSRYVAADLAGES